MKYISETDIRELGISWRDIFSTITNATMAVQKDDYSQPVKPYLRYGDLKNRIIAMPAYVGGEYKTAGIKWIASFPGNVEKHLPRAHSVIILNEAATGLPYAIINTALISAVRTAGVSGAVIDKYLSAIHPQKKISAGIIGMGPIGQTHIAMLSAAFEENIDRIYVYDLNKIDLEKLQAQSNIEIIECNNWEEVFDQSKIFITCTVSGKRYIDKPAVTPSLHLNVSLRDYEAAFMQQVNLMVVDNWEEICRENTDIEYMHKNFGLVENNVFTIGDVLLNNLFSEADDKVIMFNPMGMAVYDISVARYYYELSNELAVGTIMQ